MDYTIKAICTLAALLFVFRSFTGGANAALLITNWERTETTLSFELTGTITDDNPGPNQQNRLFIGTSGVGIGADVMNDGSLAGTAVSNGGYTSILPHAVIFNAFEVGGNDVLQISSEGSPWDGRSFRVGDTFNHTISFTGLTNGLNIVDNPTISWGRDVFDEAPEAAYEIGQTIPEPSSVFFLVLGVASLIARFPRER